MRTAFLFLFKLSLLVFFMSCATGSSEKNRDVDFIVCNYSKLSDDVKELRLSDFVEDFSLMRLDNSDNAFFKAWLFFTTDNYIGISQRSGGSFKLFDRKGNYLCDVGKSGNGPGEYPMSVYDAVIDENGNRIFLSTILSNKILVYGIDGNWIKDITMPEEIGKLIKPRMRLNDDGTLSVVHIPMSKKVPYVFCIDVDGNIVKHIPTPANIAIRDIDGEVFAQHNSEEFDFRHTSNDTVFIYDYESNTLSPDFTMDFSDLEKKPFNVHVRIPKGVFSTCFFWDSRSNRPGESKLYFTDRKTGMSEKVRLVNDFFGNFPSNGNFSNGYYVECFEPSELKSKIDEHLASGKCPKVDEEKLRKLSLSLNEDDNNILFIGKLKK